ncbi:MAG: cystathionine beta-lyase/cystathionine gamma-synthase, partial [Paraglaciecola sp.]
LFVSPANAILIKTGIKIVVHSMTKTLSLRICLTG